MSIEHDSPSRLHSRGVRCGVLLGRKSFRVFMVVCHVPVAPLGLGARGFGRFYTPFAPLGLLKTGAHCAPYKMYFSNRLLVRTQGDSCNKT